MVLRTNGDSHTNGSIPPWRIYFYGAGFIACQHAVAAETLPHVQIFAADPSPVARETFVAKFPQATVYDDAEAMLASSPAQDRDIVIVAVPPWLHHVATLAAFRSKRHVLCEKPVARTETELSEMIAASRSANRIFTECSIRYLGNGALVRARQLIESGEIGTPYHARLVNRMPRARPGIEYQPESRWFLDKAKAGGGTIFDWGVYDLTMFFDVLRPVKAIVHRAWVATPPTGADPAKHPITVETHAGAAITLILESGATVAFDYERACGFHGEAEANLSIDGTEGGLSWQWVPTFDSPQYDPKTAGEGAEENFTLKHFVDVDGEVVVKEEGFEAFGWDGANQRPLLAFVDSLEGKESVTVGEARLEFNFSVLTAMYKSVEEGVPVEVVLKSDS